MSSKNKRNILDVRGVVILLSVVLAMLSWIIVSGFIQPGKDKLIEDIPIDLWRTENTYRNRGLQIVNMEELESLTATVQVSGNYSIIGPLGKTDVLIYADFNSVTTPGIHEVTIKWEKQASGTYDITDWGVGRSMGSRTITVEFERVESKVLPLEAQVDGISAAEGYFRGSPVVSPDDVEVSGPANQIARVNKAVVIVEEEEVRTDSVHYKKYITLLDENGVELATSEHPGLFTFSVTLVEVDVPILQERTLDLTVGFSNVPAGLDEEWLRSLMTLSPASIQVTGQAADLEKLTDEYEVAVIDLSTIEEDKSFSFALTLPGSITNRNPDQEIIVTFDYDKLAVKTFEATNIDVVNVPRGLRVAAVDTSVTVTLIGSPEQLAQILPEHIIVQVDAFSLSPSGGGGRQTVAARVLVAQHDQVFPTGTYGVICDVSTT